MQKSITSLKVSFVARKKNKTQNFVSLYARIKGLGTPAEISLKKEVEERIWVFKHGRISGRGNVVDELNRFLETVRFDLGTAFREIYMEGACITAHAVKNRYLGIDQEELKGVLFMFEYHKKRETGKLAYGSMKNYATTHRYVKEYIRTVYKKNEFLLENLKFSFIDGFEVFLREYKTPKGQRPLHNNGIMKHIQRLQKVVNLAIKLDYISKNPFILYKCQMETPQQVYLTADELEAFYLLKPTLPGLKLVKDLFIFACYTGLAYVDLLALTPNDFVLGLDRMIWIQNVRRKSGQPYKVPLLPRAHKIYEQYKIDQRSIVREASFPKISAQKFNGYLKDLAKQAKINKNITYYVARHTFATTVTLSNGVPIESVSKMLGHSKLTTTQIYARVVDAKLSSDMVSLRDKIGAAQRVNQVIDLNANKISNS